MTRETKVGLMMVALLVGVFGFLVYKRVHRPSEALANQESADLRLAENSDVISRRTDNETPPLETADRPRLDRGSASRGTRDDDFSAQPPKRNNPFAEETPKSRKLKLPTEVVADDDGFEQFRERKTVKQTSLREQPIEPMDNVFDDVPPRVRAPRVIAEVAQVTDSDPFAGDTSESTTGSDEPRFTEPARRERPLQAPKDLDDGTASSDSAIESVATDRGVPLSEPRRSGRPMLVQQTSDFDNRLEPAPRETRRAAPVSFADGEFTPESSTRTTASVGGSNYVVEPNDNFWTISRKRYGVGRYYMALARHNQQMISDPKRMKPGVTISTPDVAVLEQRYAELIPKAAPIDSAPAVVTTQSRKSENAGPPGYFVSADGSPMYRIGDQDTLTDIAKAHLGRSSRWVQILEMNRNVLRDGNELKIGTVVRLPADASRVQIVGTSREFR